MLIPIHKLLFILILGLSTITSPSSAQTPLDSTLNFYLTTLQEIQDNSPLAQANHAYDIYDDTRTITLLKDLLAADTSLETLLDAHKLLSETYARNGDYENAINQLESRLLLLSPVELIDVYETLQDIAALYTEKGDGVTTVETLLRQHALAEPNDRPSIVAQIENLLQVTLTMNELHVLSTNHPTKFPGDSALASLIQRYDQKGKHQFFMISDLTKQLQTQFPDHAYTSMATTRLNELHANLQRQQHIIGVLLPLTGPLESYATDVLAGIRLALTDAQPTTSISLVVVDITQSNHTLVEHATKISDTFQPIAIIGPLLSDNLDHLKIWATTHEIPILSPTAHKPPNTATNGDFLFSTAVSTKVLGQTIARYAMLELGMTQFAILSPNDPYGLQLSSVFSQTVTTLDGDILATVSYAPGETDFGSYIEIIKTEDLKRDGTLLPPLEEEEEREEYFPGLDAIFLPDDHKTVGLIASHLHYHDMNITLLGTIGWNTPDLLRYGEKSIEGAVFVDPLNMNSTNYIMKNFATSYRYHYQTDPSELVALAYDSTRIILHTLTEGATNSVEVSMHLRRLHDFPSLSGPASMTTNGLLERPLFVLKVERGTIVQIN